MKKLLGCAISALFLITLACRPVIAVGWNEFLVLILLIAVLLGPMLFRFIQRLGDFLKREKKDK
jgi:hypothetical protein